MINLWANFLSQEKLTPKSIGEEGTQVLLDLTIELANRKVMPSRRPYSARIASRRLIVVAAMDLGIDLMAITKVYDGKVAMGRGLIDVWHKVYAERFGSNYGTASWAELRRRRVVTKLSLERTNNAACED
jgi:hypothetical protein